jgi:hypothetical protein
MACIHPDFEILRGFTDDEIFGIVETAFCAAQAEAVSKFCDPDIKPSGHYTEIIVKMLTNVIALDGSRADVIRKLTLDEGGWPGFPESVADKIPMVAEEELRLAAAMRK